MEGNMKVLVTIESNPGSVPLDMTSRVMEGAIGWIDRYEKKGKIESIWGYAGQPAGVAILDVKSPEELDQIMTEMPLAAFSEVRVQVLTDARDSLQNGMKAFDDMARR
jgi:muconolactone delta-isomerase